MASEKITTIEERMKLFLSIIILCFPFILIAGETQKSNQIPYNSKGNVIALTVENSAEITAKNVTVEINNPPKWMRFDSTTIVLSDILSKKTKDAEFTFSVERGAPVGKEQKLNFRITSIDKPALQKDGRKARLSSIKPVTQEWTKEILVTVEAPKEFYLYDNFPNPFNPTTKIAFEIPKQSEVRVIIYDILGRIVKQLVDETREAGYYEYTWDGRNDHGATVSSGLYFCRVSTQNWHAVKKMVMAK